MKDLKKMTKKERKEVFVATAKEAQVLCEFEPAIKTDGKSEKEIIAVLTEAYTELTPEDVLSKEAITTFEFLGLRKLTKEDMEEDEGIVDAEEVEEEEPPVKKKTPKKAKVEKKPEPEEEEDEKPKKKAPKKANVEKKEGQVSMAIFMDEVVEGKGTFEELAALVTEEYEERGKSTKCTVGTLKSHIKYRINQDSRWLKSRKLKMTEDAIQ